MLSLDLFKDIPIPPETIKYSRNKINSVWSRWTALLDSRISLIYYVYPLKLSMPGNIFSRRQNDISPENVFICKLPPTETICIKRQVLFPEKNISLSSAEFARMFGKGLMCSEFH